VCYVGVFFFETCLNSRAKGSSDDVLRGIKAKVELRSLDARWHGREIGCERLWFFLRTAGELI